MISDEERRMAEEIADWAIQQMIDKCLSQDEPVILRKDPNGHPDVVLIRHDEYVRLTEAFDGNRRQYRESPRSQ